jgi:hypothetical protein
MVLYAFLDESCTSDRSAPIFGVSGVLYKERSAEPCKRAWKKTLQMFGIEHWHTVDSCHRQGVFRGIERAKIDQLYKTLLGLINRHAFGSVTVFSWPSWAQDMFGLGRCRCSRPFCESVRWHCIGSESPGDVGVPVK